MNVARQFSKLNKIGMNTNVTGSRINTSLNTAYVNGTSGTAFAIRFMALTAEPINEVYIFLDANTGTLANITMEAAIYNENTATRAGTTQRDVSTTTTMPNAVDKWIKFEFGTPYTPTVGEILWIVFYNTSSVPGTDYPQILGPGNNNTLNNIDAGEGIFAFFTTTNGFTSNGSSLAPRVPFVIKQGTNTIYGNPYTRGNIAVYSNNQLQRGIRITLPSNKIIIGTDFDGSSAWDKLRIYEESVGPGGSPLYEWDLDSDTNETTCDTSGAKIFDTPITLYGGKTYNVVFTYGANSTLPTVLEVEDYSSYSSVFDAIVNSDLIGIPPGIIDDGAGGWTLNKSICPILCLIINDEPQTVLGRRGKF